MRRFGLCIFLFLSSCAPQYQAVRILQDPASLGKPQSTIQESRWAITRNGVLIPEYVIGSDNTYPDSEQEAWKRFNERKNDVESLIQKKYILPDNTSYAFGKNTVGSVLMIGAPLFIPVQAIAQSSKPEDERKSVGELLKDYNDLAYGEPQLYKEPKLKDKYLGY